MEVGRYILPENPNPTEVQIIIILIGVVEVVFDPVRNSLNIDVHP